MPALNSNRNYSEMQQDVRQFFVMQSQYNINQLDVTDQNETPSLRIWLPLTVEGAHNAGEARVEDGAGELVCRLALRVEWAGAAWKWISINAGRVQGTLLDGRGQSVGQIHEGELPRQFLPKISVAVAPIELRVSHGTLVSRRTDPWNVRRGIHVLSNGRQLCEGVWIRKSWFKPEWLGAVMCLKVYESTIPLPYILLGGLLASHVAETIKNCCDGDMSGVHV